MKCNTFNRRGFTLVELVMVIVILGIIASVVTRQISTSVETAQYEKTKNELDQLAFAIAGNPRAHTAGTRTDFGYVGHVGALPLSLDNLAVNPGGYATWRGPYIIRGMENDDFKLDAWNVAYQYSNTLLRSVGSGANIDKIFAASTDHLLNNTVSGYIRDANGEQPGTTFKDSLTVIITYPDGTGGVNNVAAIPSASGRFSFAGVPVGNHSLRLIYLPDSDTISLAVSVEAGARVKLDLTFPADLW